MEKPKLIVIAPEYLKVQTALPFGLRNGSGRLLLAAGHRITDQDLLADLQRNPVFAEVEESAEWRRRCLFEMESKFHQNAPLGKIAEAQPTKPAPERINVGLTPQKLLDAWRKWEGDLEAIQRDMGPQTSWAQRLADLKGLAHRLMQRAPDASLYALIYTASHHTDSYSARQSLLCFALAHEVAGVLGWDSTLKDSLLNAALTMNIAMRRLQDKLATTDIRLSPEMRAEISKHAEQGANLLADAGVTDEVWLSIVRGHHAVGSVERALGDMNPGLQAATVLNRIDRYAAKLSPRRTRPALTPLQAAREVCLSPSGRPNEIGAALLKALGVHPPGSIVELTQGELAIVHSRGVATSAPRVVILINAEGAPVINLALRDSGDKRYAIASGIRPATFRMTPQHAQILALR